MQDDLIQECQNVILVDVWNDCAGKVMGWMSFIGFSEGFSLSKRMGYCGIRYRVDHIYWIIVSVCFLK